MGSAFAGWSAATNIGGSPASNTCANTNPDLTNPCTIVFGGNGTITVTFNGAPVNQAPVNSVPGPQTTSEDVAEVFSSANSNLISISDADAGTNPVQVTLSGVNGTVTLNGTTGLVFSVGDGTNDATMTFTGTIATINARLSGLSFSPSTNFNGSASLTITTNDQGFTGTGGPKSDTDTMAITVTAVNDAPVAFDDTVIDTEDTVLNTPTATLLANDTDVDSATLTVTAVSGATGGTAVLMDNGTPLNKADDFVRFTPTANLCGTGAGSYDYTVSDGSLTDTGHVTVNITCVNDAPVAVDDTATVTEDDPATTIDVLANDTDIDGGPLFIDSVTQPANGTVVITNAGADLTYTPNADYCNDGDPTDDFTYTLNGGSTATVAVTVTCVNDNPVAVNDEATTDEDTAVTIAVLANDTDVDGDPVTIDDYDALSAEGGTVSCGSTCTYTPPANFFGTDTFTYDITDGNGGLASATVTIIVNSVNDAPVAVDDEAATAEDNAVDVDVLDNDTDVESDVLSVESFDAASAEGGTITLNLNGTLHYTPALDFNGIDTFTYVATDGQDSSNSATVSITVTEVNDAPIAGDDSATVAEDDSVNLELRTNDSTGPANESTQTLTVDSVSDPANGTAVIELDGTVTYTPDPDYNGPDSFTYIVCDDGTTAGEPASQCDEGLVSITVTEVNDAPIVTAGADQSINENDSATVSATFTDVDSGQTHTCSIDWDDGTITAGVVTEPSGSTPGSCSGSHQYLDDAPSSTASDVRDVVITITDDGTTSGDPDPLSDSAEVAVTVSNVPPTVVITGPISIDESQTVRNYAFNTTDPGTLDTFTAGTPNCGTGVFVGPIVFSAVTGDGSFNCRFADDNPTGTPSDSSTVSITITDDDTGAGTGSLMVTVTNVAPAITFADATFNQVSGNVTSTLTFTDVGVPDTETAAFKYTWTGTTSGTQTNTYTDRPFSATVVDVQHFDPGCYSILVEMFVTDDDTGSDSYSENLGTNLDFYQAAFRPPIRDDMRNIAKYGNVVPVKVELRSMCFPGTTVTSPTLHITIVLGDQTDNDGAPDTLVAESVSGADNGTQMRLGGGGYIYNLSTRSMMQNKEYTIRIREGSSIGPITHAPCSCPRSNPTLSHPEGRAVWPALRPAAR
ncbi:MAG: tandem-95 repeat protein [Chloroflexi bacterium]|nr:tandem-95 repeat protein [Chloroflexota bacterium]